MNSDLLYNLSEGSHDAFRQIFSRYYSKVLGFCLSILKNHDAAEELTQIVFIKIWQKRGIFATVRNFEAYLFQMTKNTVFNYIKEQHFEYKDIADFDFVSKDKCEDKILYDEMSLLIDMIVDQMPAQRKKIVQMSRFQCLSNDEIALKLGLKKKTVENHLNLALKELKKQLSIIK